VLAAPGGEAALLLQLELLAQLAQLRTIQQELANDRQLLQLLRCAVDMGGKRALLRR
jgi:hypothetical protein